MNQCAKDWKMRRLTRAVMFIQRAYRRFKRRRETNAELSKRIQKHQAFEEQQFLESPETMWAAQVIVKYWRKYKRGKITEGLVNPSALGKTMEVIVLERAKDCMFCMKKPCEKQCPSCNEAFYCDSCFSDLHGHGARKRHNYKRVVFGNYDPSSEMKSLETSLKYPGKEAPNSVGGTD
jgi:hypothetical protein